MKNPTRIVMNGTVLCLLTVALACPLRALADSTGEHSPTAASPSGFTNALNAFACGGGTATATANGQTEIYSAYGLTLPNTVPTPVVTGIQVRVRANDGTKNNRKLQVSLSSDGGNSFTSGVGVGVLQTRNFRRNAPLKDYILGGSAVLWGRPSWSASDLSDAHFRVKVLAKEPGQPSSDNINLDCIPVTVFYTIPGLPDLSVAKTASPDPVGPTGNLTYTITYSNSGQSTATNVTVTDVIPANTTFVSASSGGTLSGGTVTWNVGSVPIGGSGVVTLTVKVNASVGTQIVNDTYSIASDQNPATAGNPVSTNVANAVLTLTKLASPNPVAPGGTLTYTLTLTNGGSVGAVNLVLNEGYDANAPFASQTTSPAGCLTYDSNLDQWGGGVCVGGSQNGQPCFDSTNCPGSGGPTCQFAAGATCTVTIATTVASPLDDGVLLLNTADTSDDAADTASASAFSVVQQCAGQANGSPCNDRDACTQTDTCQNQLCVGSNPVVCTAQDQCHVAGTCDPSTGMCSNPNAPDGTGCDDGLFCDGTDKCSGGTCTAHSGDPCVGGPECNNVCNETAGNCIVTANTPCTDDGNPCTNDQCDGAGMCAHPNKPDSTACDDMNPNTVNDQCESGTCVGSTRTPTDTPTSTPTDTPTETPTHTATPTHTPTATPTLTPTPTDTATDTPTSTPTDTPTDTPSSTPTETPTETPTNTPVPTCVPDGNSCTTNSQCCSAICSSGTCVGPTVTPTITPTVTDTPTVTHTPTVTQTSTSTATKTPTVTATPTRTPTQTPLPGLCAPAPLTGCKTPAPSRGLLALSKKATDLTKSKMVWKWNKGQATSLMNDLGDPTTTTNYRLCIYDGSGTLTMNLAVPAGGTCSGKPCWKATNKGFKYKDKLGTSDGVTALSLQSGVDGKAKIGAKGKGMNLSIPTLPLDQTTAVHVQLINSTTAACWDASYSTPAKSRADDTSKWKDSND